MRGNRSIASWFRAVCLGFALPALISGAAQAQLSTCFVVGGNPDSLTTGADGNLWFADSFGRIGRITPLGVVTEFTAGITAGSGPFGITSGPDGNLWFTEAGGNRIGQITPLGVVTEFSVGITAAPGILTTGSDGNLWFTENSGDRIGRITPLGVVTEFSAGITPGAGPDGIINGPDGNLWFTESAGNRIGQITPLGVVTEFSVGITPGGGPIGIITGPDGNLWFTEPEPAGNRIGRITPLGVVTEFITAGGGPRGLTAGPDGNLWFTESRLGTLFANQIGRITPAGVVTEFSAGITASVAIGGLTAGPDGNLWFTENFNPSGMPHVGGVARITPLGVVTEGIAPGNSVFVGPDGNLWTVTFDIDNPASAICRVVLGAAGPPTIMKFFGGGFSSPIILNESTSLQFFVGNPNSFFALTGVAFTDTLPAGLVVSTPNGLTGSCGAGTVVATAGSGAVSLAGATLAAKASCTFSVNVTGTTLGTKNNITGAVTSVEGGSGGTASASVSVVATGPPTIAMSFGAASIPLNRSTSLNFTINNPNPSTPLTGVGFANGFLQSGLVVSTPNGLAGSCGGGTIVANAGSNAISLTGATLAGSASCTFSVNVTGITLGTFSVVTSPVTSVEGGSGGDASATITVAGTSFHTTTPCRVIDTRGATSALGGPALAAGAARDFVVTGTCGIPAAAVSISVNVTTTEPTSSGTVFTLPAALPLLAFQAGVTRANNAFLLLALDGSGAVTFSNDLPSGSVQLIVDVNGWWQ